MTETVHAAHPSGDEKVTVHTPTFTTQVSADQFEEAVKNGAHVIPCHLIIPKGSLDKAREIRATAERTLFKGSDLYLLDSLDVGDYAYGPDLKRELIKRQLAPR